MIHNFTWESGYTVIVFFINLPNQKFSHKIKLLLKRDLLPWIFISCWLFSSFISEQKFCFLSHLAFAVLLSPLPTEQYPHGPKHFSVEVEGWVKETEFEPSYFETHTHTIIRVFKLHSSRSSFFIKQSSYGFHDPDEKIQYFHWVFSE